VGFKVTLGVTIQRRYGDNPDVITNRELQMVRYCRERDRRLAAEQAASVKSPTEEKQNG
jgi:hypothetical protein